MPNQLVWRLNEIAMSKSHLAYLNLGSNIQPETNLLRAVKLLSGYGALIQVSNAWESKSVGATGPNYLNACVLLKTTFTQVELKEKVIRPIEASLGRKRSENKYAPRPIDIDIILFDDKSMNDKYWGYAFVVIPLAEIYPEYLNPLIHETITITATRLHQEVWLETRPEILSQFR